MNSIIRPYQSKDRDAVRHICCETGFMGEPMEVYMDGREVFGDLWSSYYTDYEPDHTWVAEVDGRVVGYILGGIDTHHQEKILAKKILPKIALKTITTDCLRSRRTWKYIRHVMRSAFRGELKMPNIAREYPAHLHTNLLDGYRGIGLGKKLMTEWLNHVREHRAPAIHLVTTTYNKIAVPFYRHIGFKTLFENPVTLWNYIVDEPIAILGMGMKLDR